MDNETLKRLEDAGCVPTTVEESLGLLDLEEEKAKLWAEQDALLKECGFVKSYEKLNK